MDLKQIDYFVRVAELGSFTRAAAVLDVAQPALSRQIRLLEVELGQHLLQRNGRGAVVTEAGALLLEHGRGILHQVERAKEELGRMRGGLSGRVALGLPPSVARALAVPLAQRFMADMPLARLAITEGLSTTLTDALTSGRLDIALLYAAPAMASAPGLAITPLATEALMLVQSRAHMAVDASDAAIDLAALAKLPLVIPSQPNAIRMQLESALARAGRKPTVAFEIDGVSAILDLVADGAGCAILSANAVASAPKPDLFHMRAIDCGGGEHLAIPLSLAVSALRPTTHTQHAAIALVTTLVQQRLVLTA